jgi:predicted DCC family thiol-disulfide oxidoreductase YuxK
MAISSPDKHLVLYDGSCGFCSRSMVRWRKAGEGIIDFAPVQSGAGEAYGFRADQPMGALHLVETSGDIRRGAAAVFRMMELCSSPAGALLWKLYRNVPAFRVFVDLGYRLVSSIRTLLPARACRIPDALGRGDSVVRHQE